MATYNARLRHALENAEKARLTAKRESRARGELLYSSDLRAAQAAWESNNLPQTKQILKRQLPEPGEDDFREFAWYWLWEQCHPDHVRWQAHEEDVFCVAYSPDGKWIASAGKDTTAKLWDATTYELRHVMRGHTSEVTCLDFAPDGECVVTGSEDHTLRVWNVSTGDCFKTLQGHTDHVLAVALSPDGQQIASGSRDQSIKVWDLNKTDVLQTLHGPSEAVRAVTYSADGSVLFAGDEGGWVGGWTTGDWQLCCDERIEREDVFAMAVSPTEPKLAITGRLDVVHLWSHQNGVPSEKMQLKGGHNEWIQAVAFSPSGDTLVSADKSGVIQLWNDTSDRPRKTLDSGESRVWSLDWDPASKSLISGAADGTIQVWSPQQLPGGEYARVPLTSRTLSVAFAPDARQVFAGGMDGLIHQWDLPAFSPVVSRAAHSSIIDTIIFSPDGSSIASCDQSGKLRIWSPRSGIDQLVREFPSHTPFHVDWSPSGEVIAIAGTDGNTCVYDAACERLLFRDQETSKGYLVYDLGISPDGKLLAIAKDKTEVWNWADDDRLATLVGSGCARFSPNGRLLAGRRGNRTLLWDTNTWQITRVLLSSLGDPLHLAFHPNGKTLAIASRLPNPPPSSNFPADVTLWDLRTGQVLLQFDLSGRVIDALEFSPDGKSLVASALEMNSGEAELLHWTLLQPPENATSVSIADGSK